MGCGSSKQQGETPAAITDKDEGLRPIKKVQTNFSTVDYDAAATERRDTIYGPTDRVGKKSEALPPIADRESDPTSLAVASTQPQITNADRISFENRIADSNPQDPLAKNHELESKEPYRDIDNNDLSSPVINQRNDEQIPHSQIASTGFDYLHNIQDTRKEQTSNMGIFTKRKKSSEAASLTDDTSLLAVTSSTQDSYLNALSSDNDTLSPGSSRFGFKHGIPNEKEQSFDVRASTSSQYSKDSTAVGEDKPKKKSIYQKYQDFKRGPGIGEVSDEDLLKYTGKTRAEFDEWSRTAPGVAGGQAAGSLTAGGTSGIGLTAAGEGLGGWGHGAGKISDQVIR